jgi:KUP system potassium uptake protein
MEITQCDAGVFISQRKYARDILVKYGYDNANKCGNPMETNARLVSGGKDEPTDSSFDYRGALGMLMYLATSTRPDLAYALGQLSRFVAQPTQKHVGALKRVLRYLAGTSNHGIWYKSGDQDDKDRDVELVGFCDSDWGGDCESRKSTSGFVFTIAGGAISWMSRRQPIVAQSTAEAEYVAGWEASMEAMAQANILSEIVPGSKICPVIKIDNSAALVMATNPTYSRRTRHIELQWHYVRDQVQRGLIELVKVKGEQNPADAFTKPLDKARLELLCEMIGVSTMG